MRNKIHVRFGHLAEELARVAGKAFDVAPLALRVQRIERKRAFPAPADPGKADELIARKLNLNVLQIVLARSFDVNILTDHSVYFES